MLVEDDANKMVNIRLGRGKEIIFKMQVLVKKIYEKYMCGFLVLTLAFVIDLIYLSNTTANVPMMDYWRYGKDFLYNTFNGGISFNDFWKSINGQRAFLTYSLFYLNVKFFHWNTRIAIFFGAIVTYITGLICIYIVDKYELSADKKKDVVFKQILIIIIAILLFNNIQWEIKVLEFYAPFSIISLFCIINFWLADKILCDLSIDTKKVWLYAILLGICICFIYTAFFPAVVGAICICGLVNFLRNYKTQKLKYVNKYIIVGVGILLSSFIYMTGIEGIATENGLPYFFKSMINGELFKSIMAYLGSSVLHSLTVEKIGLSNVYYIGVIVALLYVVGIIVFFKYLKTINSYFPLMLILYTLFVSMLLSYGRGQVYGIAYMCSSRYAYQSKMGLIGLFMIFGCVLKNNHKNIKRNCVKYILIGISTLFIVGMMLIAQKIEYNISPYRRVYYETCIDYIKNDDSCSQEELKLLQAQEDEIRITISYMKKYRLGVFYYDDYNDIEDEE